MSSGIAKANGWLVRATGPGSSPSSRRSRFSVCTRVSSACGNCERVAASCDSACISSVAEATPLRFSERTSSSDAAWLSIVRSMIAISSSISRSRNHVVATSATSALTTPRWKSSVASNWARAASLARRRRPNRSISQLSVRPSE